MYNFCVIWDLKSIIWIGCKNSYQFLSKIKNKKNISIFAQFQPKVSFPSIEWKFKYKILRPGFFETDSHNKHLSVRQDNLFSKLEKYNFKVYDWQPFDYWMNCTNQFQVHKCHCYSHFSRCFIRVHGIFLKWGPWETKNFRGRG